MRLFIRIQDGVPFKHPILEDNFKQAFSNIDLNNLPPEFALFERIPRPTVDVYEVMESEDSTYELIDGVYKDVWQKRDMTTEEKTAKQQAVKNAWATMPNADNFSGWIFNETTCRFEPPIPYPETGDYIWHGATSSWVEMQQYPIDGKTYRLDFASATWVEVTQL